MEKVLSFNVEFFVGMFVEYCGQGDVVDVNGIYYFFWIGNQVKIYFWDILDYGMQMLAKMMDEFNDGLVLVCLLYLGMVIWDDYYMNYMDVVDQMFGLYSSKDIDLSVVYC